MVEPSLVLIDRVRAHLFRQVERTRGAFAVGPSWIDEAGLPWKAAPVGDQAFAVTALGPGWVFDPVAIEERAADLATRWERVQAADGTELGRELDAIADRLRLGGIARRVLWAVHQAVLRTRASDIMLAAPYLSRLVWGDSDDRPRHWLQTLGQTFADLAWLHITAWQEGSFPSLGADSALFGQVSLAQSDEALCPEDCPDRSGPPHAHFQVRVGRGFLGVLEQFGVETNGTRAYEFPIRGRGASGPTLRNIGRTGRLVSAYLPAELGRPDTCDRLTPSQRVLLPALVRETTRATRRRRRDLSQAETFTGQAVPIVRGRRRRPIVCPLLVPDVQYVGFNGNGKRKGLGYRLMTPGGWLARSGRSADEVAEWLADARALTDLLRLTVIGILDREFIDLERMVLLAASPAGRETLERVSVRIFAPADYLERWDVFFGWPPATDVAPTSKPQEKAATLVASMKRLGLKQKALANGIGVDPSFLGKLLQGKKKWPDGLLEKARTWLEQQAVRPVRPSEADVKSDPPLIDEALGYLRRGWSIVPMKPSSKQPYVRWKEFQGRLPTEAEVAGWFREWPDAGIGLVLGPVSGVLVVDCDAPEAGEVLLRKLGQEPVAPQVLSGSGKPGRYHLYFQHPELRTKAKVTPWHPKLEFRGQGGIVVLPPSVHPSGRRYAWAPGRSIDELEMPELPAEIQAVLRPVPRAVQPASDVVSASTTQVAGREVSQRTAEFLTGEYANASGWNGRIFQAACDLAGRGISKAEAEVVLLRAAGPWDDMETDAARRTIDSAYQTERVPGLR